MKLGVAAAQKDLDNAVLALKRARSDLSTAVRNAYFTVLVDVETLVVTRALAQFSDEIYRLQTGLLQGAQSRRLTSRRPCGRKPISTAWRTSRRSRRTSMTGKRWWRRSACSSCRSRKSPARVDRFIPYYDYDHGPRLRPARTTPTS